MSAELVHGFLKLAKVDQQDGGDLYIEPAAIRAVEPSKRGCWLHTWGAKWLVQHTVEEVLRAIRFGLEHRR